MISRLLLAIETGWNYVLDNVDTWERIVYLFFGGICFLWLMLGIVGATGIVSLLTRKNYLVDAAQIVVNK